jgi:hypothetical protein
MAFDEKNSDDKILIDSHHPKGLHIHIERKEKTITASNIDEIFE